MAKKKIEIALPTVDELFTSQEERDGVGSDAVRRIPLSRIEPFPNHPFKVSDDDDMRMLIESISEHGILVPLTVAKTEGDSFRLVSGHRRKHAAEALGVEEAPCIVRDLTDDEAIIAMVDSNLQRETILPSERAFAYSMRLEAMKRQGSRTDLTCAQVAHKLSGRKSRDILAEELGVSKDKIQRFIRLTNLIPELLELVDEGRMKMLPAVEVSYLSKTEQESLLDAIEAEACTPSHAQASKMKRYSQSGELTDVLIRSIMEEQKPNQIEQLKIPKKSIERFFKPNASAAEIEQRIIRALELLSHVEAKKTRRENSEVRDG